MRKWSGLLLALALCLSSLSLWARPQPIDYPALLALVKAGNVDDLRRELDARPIEGVSIKGRALLMMAAVGSGHADIVATLLRWGLNPNQMIAFEDQGGRAKITPLLLAIGEKNSLPTLTVLIDGGADTNLTAEGLAPLHFALSMGRLDAASYLLDHGALATTSDANGVTPLMELALGADDADPTTEAMAKRLIAAGTDVNARGRDGLTALRWAVLGGKPNLVKALLAAHADPNSANAKGETVLQVAMRKQFTEIVDLLLNAGAHP